MATRLTARWVLGFDGSDHVVFENGEVQFDGKHVVHAGARTDHPVATQTDLGDALIAPGFVDLNALSDVDTTILGFGSRGLAGTRSWSSEYARRAQDVLTREQMVSAARGAFSQLLLSGVTTALPVTSLLFRKWAESGVEFDAIAALSDELGIRLVLGPSFRSFVNVIDGDDRPIQIADEAAGQAGLDDAIAFVRRIEGQHEGLVSGLLVPSTIETCSDDLIVRTAAAAAELGVPFRLHCCQSVSEAEVIWRRTGKSSIAHLHDLGVLSASALLPHAIDLGGPLADPALIENDQKALAGSGATVVHCPLVVGRTGRRLKSFGKFRDMGIHLGLGTDTAPPNMLMNLQIGLATARIDDGFSVGPADYLRAATLGGASAIGRTDLGRLENGSAADIVVWDLSSLDVQPVHDPVEALFLMPPGLRASRVFVAGREVVRDGRLVGQDEQVLAAEMQAIFGHLRSSYRDRNRHGHDWPTLFPPAFRTH